MTPKDGDTEEKDRNFVTALARGLDVLACFQKGDTYLTNADIAGRTGLPKATISRLIYTLRSLGYLAQDPRTGSYRLDSGVLTLGYSVLAGIDIANRAQAELDQMLDGSNAYVTAGLVERHKLAAVYVASAQSTQVVSLNATIGARMPLFLSAAGLAILIKLDPCTQDRAKVLLKKNYPNRYDQGIDAFEQAQKDYATRGYTRSYGHWRNDVNGIAVPVLSPQGARIYAMNIGGPAFAVPPEQLETEYAPRLLAAGLRLSVGT
ncbi:IclR family transcriptional regulator [Halovulum sp. GXIMD14793]